MQSLLGTQGAGGRRPQRTTALALAALAVVIPLLSIAWGTFRGGELVGESSAPGGRGPGAYAAYVHPGLFVLLAGSVFGLVGVAAGARAVSYAMGGALVAVGFVHIFSVVLSFVLSGLLLLWAAARLPPGKSPEHARWANAHNALATLALVAAAVSLQATLGEGAPAKFFSVLLALTAATWLCVILRQPWPAAGFAVVALGWAFHGIDSQALGGFIPAGLAVASVAALGWWHRRPAAAPAGAG